MISPLNNRQYIISPIWDFLLLGGIALVLAPLLIFIWPEANLQHFDSYSLYAFIVLLAAYLFTYPHFAYSYQLLYQDFFKKITGRIDKPLQLHYIWASVVVPGILLVLSAYCYFKQDFKIFSLMVNVGLLITGWHYVKQGFGVLIVTSVYQKIFYSHWERRIFLLNANLLWIYAWIGFNTDKRYCIYWSAYPFEFQTLGFPLVLKTLFFCLVCISLISFFGVIVRKYYRESILPPLGGMVGYFTPFYLWVLFLSFYPFSYEDLNPIYLLVPTVHSIQYMTIVFKMKSNEVKARRIKWVSFFSFAALGVLLGYLGFVAAPQFLDKTFNANHVLSNGVFFVIIFTLFINVHHFFADNVSWRKESSRTKEYLFDFH
jgi:hypothetical protein